MSIYKHWNNSDKRYIWWIDYYDENGVRRRESTGSGSYKFAEELHTKRKDEVAQRRKLPERYIAKIKFSDFVDNDYIPIHAKGSKYEANIKGICKKLESRYGDKFLHEITSRMVEIDKKCRFRSCLTSNPE